MVFLYLEENYMTKGEKKNVGRPSELAECLVKAKEYLLGGYEAFSYGREYLRLRRRFIG